MSQKDNDNAIIGYVTKRNDTGTNMICKRIYQWRDIKHTIKQALKFVTPMMSYNATRTSKYQ